jgi:hypothetical protein
MRKPPASGRSPRPAAPRWPARSSWCASKHFLIGFRRVGSMPASPRLRWTRSVRPWCRRWPGASSATGPSITSTPRGRPGRLRPWGCSMALRCAPARPLTPPPCSPLRGGCPIRRGWGPAPCGSRRCCSPTPTPLRSWRGAWWPRGGRPCCASATTTRPPSGSTAMSSTRPPPPTTTPSTRWPSRWCCGRGTTGWWWRCARWPMRGASRCGSPTGPADRCPLACTPIPGGRCPTPLTTSICRRPMTCGRP